MRRVKTAVIGSRFPDNIFLKTLTDLFHVTDVCAIVEDDMESGERIAAAYHCKAMTVEEMCADRDIELAVLTRAGGAKVEVPFTHDFDGSFPFSDPGQFGIFGNRGIGAAECAWSIIQDRAPRADGAMGLHILEMIHGIERSGETHTEYRMQTACQKPRPIPSGYISKQMGGFVRMDGEYALTL